MGQLLADRRDIDFVLYEQLRVDRLTDHGKFRGLNRKLFDMIITEARTLAIKEILPTNAEGDARGVAFDQGRVTVPECFHRPFRLLVEGEWTATTEDPEKGGQGLPHVINQAALEYIWGANYCLANYGTMGHGTGKMIDLYGTSEQKELFLKKLYTGRWGGTMLLTEPDAGSDVGALTTTARRNPDGTYAVAGNKIFITNGEHDLTENIVHPVLARVEGAPAGTRGISIFIVPKIWVHPDGTLGDPNDVVCTGVEEKMGIHGSATCAMALGGRGRCRGWLLGEENQGMAIMFHMMNEARLSVGFQAFTSASAAYLYAANYAKTRIQGKDVAEGKRADAPSVPIIQHPDVRRMLMGMKAHVDGMRSFVYYVALLFDRLAAEPDSPSAVKWQGMIDFFIPLVKAYCSQRSFSVCVDAMQVYGGYGYIKDYPIEQLLRDCKITSIYEGTDGIQAMDLVGRKLRMNGGKLLGYFMEDVRNTISTCGGIPELAPLAERLEAAAARLEATADGLLKEEVKPAFVAAFPFLEATGDVIMAWMLLWRAAVAAGRLLENPPEKDKTYYQGLIRTAEYFVRNGLPLTMGRMEAIQAGDDAALSVSDACFGG